MIKKSYNTNRLLLVQPNLEMANSIFDFYYRNKDFFKEFDPYRPDIFYKLNTHKNIIKKEMDDTKNSRMLKFYLFKIEDRKKIIGMISFANIVKGSFLSCTVGYKLDKDETKKGYMTEALKYAIDIVFKELKLHRIEANIMPHNKPSLDLARRLGFEYEGLAKKYLKINNKWEDHIHMTILNDDI
ncbi:GNAT family N-acetyltransferase [Brachyspira pilosicoli]|uniref:GNAT family N-acetyltransferase n=1 Tax=Brachyspira pilosicoli TaxID=52584 RepID=UPI002543B81A|nr:GNAT family N-acetyltransferase [Brachyspira pilosicoli]WIH82128.1 GNAT family N-acetyltransferase [Brachyspira pilosicoli]